MDILHHFTYNHCIYSVYVICHSYTVLHGFIQIHRFYEILVTAFHSNSLDLETLIVRPRVRTCAVQLAGYLYGAHGQAHSCFPPYPPCFSPPKTGKNLPVFRKATYGHWGPDAMEPILQNLRPAKQAVFVVEDFWFMWCLIRKLL